MVRKELSVDKDFDLSSYHHCLSWMICNPPLPGCFELKCENCLATSTLKKEIANLLDENGIDEIIYKQWISTDRFTLETLIIPTDDELIKKLLVLMTHSFIAKEQSKFLDGKKVS